MTMAPSIRKLTLTAHVATSVGWLGALTVFFAHALAGLLSDSGHVVRAASLAMGLTAWFVIMPLSIATLVTGLVQALGTAWGLLRHYWVLFKFMSWIMQIARPCQEIRRMEPLLPIGFKATRVRMPDDA